MSETPMLMSFPDSLILMRVLLRRKKSLKLLIFEVIDFVV